jgi:hypothetical protein
MYLGQIVPLRLVYAVGAVVLGLVAVVGFSQSGRAAANKYWLDPGESLSPQQAITSANGQYHLVMREDGNVVLHGPADRALWTTGTGVPGSRIVMHSDGNLVVYTPGNTAVWTSGTRGTLRLELQDDANLVLYTVSGHSAVWAAATITNRDDVGRVKYHGYVAMRNKAWPDSEWSCLDQLWSALSGWRWNATDSSGAYGIPKALPPSKMAASGADWRDNPATQIAWGIGYIKGRYGSPCRALSQFDATGWY